MNYQCETDVLSVSVFLLARNMRVCYAENAHFSLLCTAKVRCLATEDFFNPLGESESATSPEERGLHKPTRFLLAQPQSA